MLPLIARNFAARTPSSPGRFSFWALQWAEDFNEALTMSEHIYKHLELTGSSTTSIQDAIERAVARAAQTVRNMRWLEVIDTRGHIEDGKIAHWQVTVKIGFTLEE